MRIVTIQHQIEGGKLDGLDVEVEVEFSHTSMDDSGYGAGWYPESVLARNKQGHLVNLDDSTYEIVVNAACQFLSVR